MNNELTWERIIDWVEGRLSKPDADWVSAQLAQADPDKRKSWDNSIAWLHKLQLWRHDIPMRNLSEQSRQRLNQLFVSLQDATESVIRVINAYQTSDSWVQVPQGVRRGGPPSRNEIKPESRQFIYQCEVGEVALNLRQASDKNAIELRGQIFVAESIDLSGFVIQLIHGQPSQLPQQSRMEMLDDLGQFALNDLAPGNYDLVIADQHTEIHIADLPVQL